MADDVQIKDFTFAVEPIKFKINDDVFFATPELPLGLLQDLTKFKDMTSQLKDTGIEPLLELFDDLLLDESAAIFRARTGNKKNPIGVRHIMALIPWLLEEYGLRPTQPSSNLSDGSSDGETGTSSTDGASLNELMSRHSAAQSS